jgi:hypothetical protein
LFTTLFTEHLSLSAIVIAPSQEQRADNTVRLSEDQVNMLILMAMMIGRHKQQMHCVS